MSDDAPDQGSAPGSDPADPHRPVIEKRKADEEIIIPEGHERGEVMTIWQKIFYRMVWLFVVGVARLFFRVQVHGKEHVPDHGAFIVSPIHRSNLDTPLIANITRKRRLRYMGKESLWKTRFGAWFFTTAGGFPVDRATADRDALRACLEVAERGEPLVMFPEGTRQFGPVVQEFFDGAAFIQSRTGVPIVPVGIGGSETAMPKGAKFIKPHRVRLVIGPPLLATEAEGPKAKRAAIKARTAELHGVIQELFDQAQVAAGTPNRR